MFFFPIQTRPGSLSDALGLLNGGSTLAVPPVHRSDRSAPISPRGLPPLHPLQPQQLRSVSSPATPDSPLVRCARSLSQAAIGPLDKGKNSGKI